MASKKVKRNGSYPLKNKINRRENKKKKLKALVEISKLNEADQGNMGLCRINYSKNKKSLGASERMQLRKDVEFRLNGEEKANEVPQVFGDLNEEQQKLLRKLLGKRTDLRQKRPYLDLTQVGEKADLRTPADKRVPITFDDFQTFVLYSALHSVCTKGVPRWVEIGKPSEIQRRIFLVLEGAGLQEYLENEAVLTTLSQFESRLEVVTPLTYGGDMVEELVLVPLSNTQRDHLVQVFGSLDEAKNTGEVVTGIHTIFRITKSTEKKTARKVMRAGPDKFPRTQLVLSAWELFEEKYPLPIIGSHEERFLGFVKTRDEYSELNEDSPMWAVDCEMCQTVAGNELTRICIINEDHDVVYESLVKPHNPITNYHTKFSGITPAMLHNVTIRLEDVQQHIRSICPPDVIFVGQSLNFDLMALKMFHPYVIDTSIIFNLSGDRARRTKLRVLTEEFLSERIQLNESGHNPIEDALAAMKLVQAKLQHSLSWGNAVLSGPRQEAEVEASRTLLSMRIEAGVDRLTGVKDYIHNDLPRQGDLLRQEDESKTLFSHLTKFNRNVLLVGKEEQLERWSQYPNPSPYLQVHTAATDRLAIKIAKRKSPEKSITFVHISLDARHPTPAIIKADKLARKMLKNPQPNTLYCVLLAGRTNCSGNGLLFPHLVRAHVPFVRLPPN